MYFLFLVALLQVDALAPKPIAPPTGAEVCFAAAHKMNHDDARLQAPDAKELGLQYVCMKLVADT